MAALDEQLEGLAEATRIAANSVFDDEEVGNCTYSTLTEEGYDELDLIVDDLRHFNDSNLIDSTSKKLMYIMTQAEKYKLYQILLQVYKLGVTEVSNMSLESSSEPDADALLDSTIEVVKQVNAELSAKQRAPIDMDGVLKLFRSEASLTAISLLIMSYVEFCEKAKKYGIPAGKARKLLNALRSRHHNQQALYVDDEEMLSLERRFEWKVTSKCQIYSRSNKRWCDGEIVNIFTDDEGEWLRVKYQIQEGLDRFKSIQRYNQFIRALPKVVLTQGRKSFAATDADAEAVAQAVAEVVAKPCDQPDPEVVNQEN